MVCTKLLRHIFIRPSQNPLVSHCYSFKVRPDYQDSFAIPDGCIDLFFDCSEDKVKALVCGTTLDAQDALFEPNQRYFGVRFAAGVIPHNIDIASGELINQQLDLLDAIPKMATLAEKLSTKTIFVNQANLVEIFFLDEKVQADDSITHHAALYIRQKSGNIRLPESESLTEGFKSYSPTKI